MLRCSDRMLSWNSASRERVLVSYAGASLFGISVYLVSSAAIFASMYGLHFGMIGGRFIMAGVVKRHEATVDANSWISLLQIGLLGATAAPMAHMPQNRSKSGPARAVLIKAATCGAKVRLVPI